jgi:2-methylisocitrate lyase-like PEP mutase family enzyme
MTVNVKARALRERLAKGEFILAPGIYDGISARVANQMGFPALYMTGYGATASMLGLPDAGLATYSDMVGRAVPMATARPPAGETCLRFCDSVGAGGGDDCSRRPP